MLGFTWDVNSGLENPCTHKEYLVHLDEDAKTRDKTSLSDENG